MIVMLSTILQSSQILIIIVDMTSITENKAPRVSYTFMISHILWII